eukprot:1456244-Pleurochrysis_carterae.AAC.2
MTRRLVQSAQVPRLAVACARRHRSGRLSSGENGHKGLEGRCGCARLRVCVRGARVRVRGAGVCVVWAVLCARVRARVCVWACEG